MLKRGGYIRLYFVIPTSITGGNYPGKVTKDICGILSLKGYPVISLSQIHCFRYKLAASNLPWDIAAEAWVVLVIVLVVAAVAALLCSPFGILYSNNTTENHTPTAVMAGLSGAIL